MLGRLEQHEPGDLSEPFLAVDEPMSGVRRLVTLRMLRAALQRDPVSVFVFKEEARCGIAVRHAGLVQTIAAGEDRDRPYVVTEFLHGPTLHDLLERAQRRREPLPPQVAIGSVGDALRGLHHLHEARGQDGAPLEFVHRHISPSNIVATRHGHAKLSGFGVARHALEETLLLKGQLRYLAPELVLGSPPSVQSDSLEHGRRALGSPVRTAAVSRPRRRRHPSAGAAFADREAASELHRSPARTAVGADARPAA
ncbi:MAG: protein kinase [Myxococcales bacterium]